MEAWDWGKIELGIAPRGARRIPIAAIVRQHRHRFDGAVVKAARVDAHPIGVGSGNIERLHTAVPAKIVLGDARVERVGGELVAPLEQPEAVRRHDQVQIPDLVAYRAVALGDLDAGARLDFEPYAAAMTSARVLDVCGGSEAHANSP